MIVMYFTEGASNFLICYKIIILIPANDSKSYLFQATIILSFLILVVY